MLYISHDGEIDEFDEKDEEGIFDCVIDLTKDYSFAEEVTRWSKTAEIGDEFSEEIDNFRIWKE